MAPGKKVHLEIEFDKMIGAQQFVTHGDRGMYKWNSSPICVKLGTVSVGDTIVVIPDLMFSDRYDDEFL